MRIDGRKNDQVRHTKVTRNYIKHAEGSVLIEVGDTKVICTASIEDKVPPFLKGTGEGWITAEYNMLPRSTATRKVRDIARLKLDGRTMEIQRLIGRALRSVVDLKALGEKTIWIDCDVIQADGGTRTTSITGAFIALIGGIFIYYITSRNKNKKEIIAVCTIVGLLSLLFVFIQNKITKITPIGEIVISFNSRIGIWEGSTKMFFKKPILGWGLLGTFERGSNFIFSDDPSLHNQIISFLIHPHNLWLTFLVSTGVIGLGIYLYIKFNLYKDMTKLYKEKNQLFPLLAATNAMIIIQGIVDCTLYAPQLGIMFVCMGAITYNIANDKMVRKRKLIKNKDITV